MTHPARPPRPETRLQLLQIPSLFRGPRLSGKRHVVGDWQRARSHRSEGLPIFCPCELALNVILLPRVSRDAPRMHILTPDQRVAIESAKLRWLPSFSQLVDGVEERTSPESMERSV